MGLCPAAHGRDVELVLLVRRPDRRLPIRFVVSGARSAVSGCFGHFAGVVAVSRSCVRTLCPG
eukprot:7397597-Alexandrium_andersonii.AAC.1